MSALVARLVKKRSLSEKKNSLVKIRDAGKEIRALADHETVKAYFDDMQKSYIAKMIACAPNDDDGRRGYALKLQALLEFKQWTSVTIGMGDAAERSLANMKDDDDA